jgi:hypothetical protein
VPTAYQKPGNRPRGTTLVVTAVLGVIVAVLVMIFVLQLASKPGAKSTLSTSTFEVGGSKVLASAIRRQRAPLLFQALVKDRDVWVQHLGDDPTTGWTSFDARTAGSPRSCTTHWDLDRQLFVDPCTQQTFPPDGQGLPVVPLTVTPNGKVSIDLHATS